MEKTYKWVLWVIDYNGRWEEVDRFECDYVMALDAKEDYMVAHDIESGFCKLVQDY
jgi:hypothetical protein